MKKKLHTRFPATRIKKIMQTDEDVGKIAMAVPLLVSKALELFLQDLCNHTYDVTVRRGAKTVSSVHLKQCVHAFNVFDFLREIVNKVPDLGGAEAEDQSAIKRRKVVDENSLNNDDMKNIQMHEVKEIRGKRGRGRPRGGGRTGSALSLKFEDDVEEDVVSPQSSESPSGSDEKPEYNKNHTSNSGLKVRDFDLNVGLDENGDSPAATTLLESPDWPILGINEMKIEPYQQQPSGNEEDYDEESIDED